MKLKILRSDDNVDLEYKFDTFIKDINPHILSISTKITDDPQGGWHYITIYYYTQEDLRNKKISTLLNKDITFNEG